jgi:AcrR family transcriptional regulator
MACRGPPRSPIQASAPLRDTVKDENGSQDWVAAGLAELARGGVDGVRIEVLAERLGVTKGGFYRRFRDRRALLNAMLKSWRDGRVTAIERQAEEGAATPAGKLGSILKLYSERANTQGIAIELAIRQWARTDQTAAGAAAQVDAARLKTVSSLFRALGLPVAEAEARAVLFYTFLFGQSLLFFEDNPRKRANLVAACARVLMDIQQE